MTQDDVFRHVGQLVLAHAQDKQFLQQELRRIADEANQRILSLTAERDAAIERLRADAATDPSPVSAK